MFAKLVVWGMDRNDAILKMRRALDDYLIRGVETTIPFCRFVMEHPKFIEGDFQIDFVQKHYLPEKLASPSEDEEIAAALAAIEQLESQNAGSTPGENGKVGRCSPWALQHRAGGAG
jgi:propionyl-CoA carboxylase alpha chain